MSSSSEAPLSEPRAAGAAQDWKKLSGPASPEEFGAAWLALAGGRCGALRGVLVVRKAGGARYAPLAFFPEGKPCGTFLADVAERALAEARPVVVEEEEGLGLAYPLERGRRIEAVAAFEFARGTGSHEALLREMQWALPWVERRLAAGEPAPAAEAPLAATLASAAAATRFEDAARAVATDLAQMFERERVGVGVAVDGRVRLAALSHTASFDPRLALPRAIEAAMQEALQAGKPLGHPAPEGAVEHDALARLAQEGAAPVLCMPVAPFVFSLEGGKALDAEAQARLRRAIDAVRPILALQKDAGQPLAARAWSATRVQANTFVGPRSRRRQLFAAAAVVLVAVLVFAKGEFRVAGDALLEGSVRRVVTAPFDGYVAASQARAGDTVREGASLAALDDRDLRLERVRVGSQRAQYARQIQEATAKHDRGQTQILQAQLAQADAQLELLDEQLRRARLIAPFDGLVVSGDLSQSIGAAVRKGDMLFEVAPLAGYRVVVFVDEADIAAVGTGQKGTLLLAAIPDATFPFSVTSVTPVARTHEGRNTFRVEAALEGAPERLRPGMEGVAKIETGSRHLVWIWTHRFTNWVRLTVWSVWP